MGYVGMRINGRVVNVDVSELSGIMYGSIEIEAQSGKRAKLKYTRDSQGEIPSVGCIVSVEYVGDALARVVSIEIQSYPEEKEYLVPLSFDPPTTDDKVSITWSKACIGCGTQDVERLIFYAHTWDSGRTVTGYLDVLMVCISGLCKPSSKYGGASYQVKESRKETRFDMDVYLCDQCKRISQNQTRSPLVLWGLIFGALITAILYLSIGVSFLFGVGGLYSQGFGNILIVHFIFFLFLAIPFTLLHGNSKLFVKPFLKYVRIKRVESGNSAIPRLFFGNRTYFETMWETNPRLKIDHDPVCKGSTDYGDGFAIGFILFLIVLPLIFGFLL